MRVQNVVLLRVQTINKTYMKKVYSLLRFHVRLSMTSFGLQGAAKAAPQFHKHSPLTEKTTPTI